MELLLKKPKDDFSMLEEQMGVIFSMFFLIGVGSCSPAGIQGSPAWERALPKGIAHFPALLD